MKAIMTKQDYEPIAKGVKEILNKKSEIPDNVFNEDYGSFLFIPSAFQSGWFLVPLKQYLDAIKENTFYVCSIDPDPIDYYRTFSKFYGAFKVPSAVDGNTYFQTLRKYPLETSRNNDSVDSLTYLPETFLFFSGSYKWAIYMERGGDFCICAFRDDAYMEKFKTSFASDVIDNVEDGAKRVFYYSTCTQAEKNALIEKFIENYGK